MPDNEFRRDPQVSPKVTPEPVDLDTGPEPDELDDLASGRYAVTSGLLDAIDRLPALSPWAGSWVVLGLRAAAGDHYRLPVYGSEEFLELDDADPRKFASVVLAAERSEQAVVVEAVRRVRQVSYDISTSPQWSTFSQWADRERAARAARVRAGVERAA